MYLINRLRALVRDDRGQDLIEYTLLAALIALASVLAIRRPDTQVNAACGNAIVGMLRPSGWLDRESSVDREAGLRPASLALRQVSRRRSATDQERVG